MTTISIDQLNNQFAIGDQLRFITHDSGLIQGVVCTAKCNGSFFLLGAHLSAFQPKSQSAPVLFQSSQSNYEEGKAIRGGVPICFPWFSAHPTDSDRPAHGLVRQSVWEVVRTSAENELVSVTLRWSNESFELRYEIVWGDSLQFQLAIQNQTDSLLSYEVALHTYLEVSDVANVTIEGLESTPFIDQLTKAANQPTGESIRFIEETDRIYQGRIDRVLLRDSGFNRTVVIQPVGSESTVIWNPWIAKSKRMADFGDDEYVRMCCVETANIRAKARQLGPKNQGSKSAELIGASISIQ